MLLLIGSWPDTKIMKESFHRKCGQRQDLHFNLVCRLSRKLISAARISLLFICTDCQRDFMSTSSFPCFKWKQSQFRGITQKKQLCFWPFILRANSHSWVGIYRLNHNKFVFKWSMFPNGTLLPSFSVENTIILWTKLKWNTQKLNQPKMVVSNWMRSRHVVWSVRDRASVCKHTFFASSANEFPWALTLECPRHINTCAAILTWTACTARTFVDVWEKTQAWTFFAWFSFCILKKLLSTFYIFKRTVVPRYPKQLSLLTNHFR